VYRDLAECVPSLTELEELFCDPGEKTLPSFLETVHYLRQEIEAQRKNFTQWYHSQTGVKGQHQVPGSKDSSSAQSESEARGSSVEKFCGKVESLIAGVLLSVQELTKSHAESGHLGVGKCTGVTKSHTESGHVNCGKCTGCHQKLHQESTPGRW
jgi:hypothetical protein